MIRVVDMCSCFVVVVLCLLAFVCLLLFCETVRRAELFLQLELREVRSQSLSIQQNFSLFTGDCAVEVFCWRAKLVRRVRESFMIFSDSPFAV